MPKIREDKQDRDPNYQARQKEWLFDRIKSELDSVIDGHIDQARTNRYKLNRPRGPKIGDIYIDHLDRKWILLARVQTKRPVQLISEDRTKRLKIDCITLENDYKRVGSIYYKSEYDDPDY